MISSRATRLSALGLLGFLVWCSASPSLEAQDRRLALDPDGTVYRLLQGTYEELFPGGTATDPTNPVLALDVLHSGEAERLVVPGTENWYPESTPSLVFENGTRQLYVIWQQLFNGIHPLFYLLSFDGVQWSEPIQVISSPYTDKGALQLAVTREEVNPLGGRTLVQLVWWEEAQGDVSRKLYAPIFLEDGADSAVSQVFDLSGILPSPADDPPAVAPAGFENVLSLRAGKNDHTEVVGFLDPTSQRLVVLELELLPAPLINLADLLRGHIVIVGQSFSTRGELAASIRDRLAELGTEFHPSTLSYLDAEIDQIVNSPDTELTQAGILNLADLLRGHIVIVGSRIEIGGLSDEDESAILDVGPNANGGTHNVKASKVFDRAAPEVGGPVQLLLSESGHKVLVAWEEDGSRIHYTESLDEGWSEPSVVELTADFDRETVYRMLEDRVRVD